MNQYFKNSKEEESMRDLKTIFVQQIQLLLSENKNVKYLLCVIDVLSKHAWVKPLKDERGKTDPNTFTEIAIESNRKPNKLWAEKGREV